MSAGTRLDTNDLDQWVLNLLVLVYPMIRIVPLCIAPNQNFTPFTYPQIKNSPKINLFWVVFEILHTPREFLTYPQGYAYPRLGTIDLDNGYMDNSSLEFSQIARDMATGKERLLYLYQRRVCITMFINDLLTFLLIFFQLFVCAQGMIKN